jgi:hypothetical protein
MLRSLECICLYIHLKSQVYKLKCTLFTHTLSLFIGIQQGRRAIRLRQDKLGDGNFHAHTCMRLSGK